MAFADRSLHWPFCAHGAQCGLTAIELLLSAAVHLSTVGYVPNPEYQRQAGLNNLAVAVAMVLASADAEELTPRLLTVVWVFFLRSGANHAWAGLREANRSIRNLRRPVGAMTLACLRIPFIIRALRAG